MYVFEGKYSMYIWNQYTEPNDSGSQLSQAFYIQKHEGKNIAVCGEQKNYVTNEACHLRFPMRLTRFVCWNDKRNFVLFRTTTPSRLLSV